MEGLDGEVAWHAANVGDPDAAAALRRCHRSSASVSLDVLVNNAATNPYYGPLMEIDLARAEKTVQVNLEAALVWTQCAWRASMAGRGGSVINLSSIGGLSVEQGIGWYNVTKAALVHLTRQLAAELGPAVRVNALAPGLVRTDFARALWEHSGDAVAKRLPLQAPRRARRHRQRRAVPGLGGGVMGHRPRARGRRGGPGHAVGRGVRAVGGWDRGS